MALGADTRGKQLAQEVVGPKVEEKVPGGQGWQKYVPGATNVPGAQARGVGEGEGEGVAVELYVAVGEREGEGEAVAEAVAVAVLEGVGEGVLEVV